MLNLPAGTFISFEQSFQVNTSEAGKGAKVADGGFSGAEADEFSSAVARPPGLETNKVKNNKSMMICKTADGNFFINPCS
ncbi:MAG: hypothetical protein V2A78_05055 [bacterium]